MKDTEDIEDTMLRNDIHRRQEVLDTGWDRSRFGQRYINGHPVSEEEYWEYVEERREEDAIEEGLLSFYRRCTSTGEEWEIDSDGIESIP